jgi:hypothetical protein
MQLVIRTSRMSHGSATFYRKGLRAFVEIIHGAAAIGSRA